MIKLPIAPHNISQEDILGYFQLTHPDACRWLGILHNYSLECLYPIIQMRSWVCMEHAWVHIKHYYPNTRFIGVIGGLNYFMREFHNNGTVRICNIFSVLDVHNKEFELYQYISKGLFR